jgi:hypothetical protein
MFEGCTIKYKKSKDTGEDNTISILYPADADGKVWHKSVPLNVKNTDYQEILKWVADGNTIEEAD